MTPLPVVILAGGLGLRQRSDGDELPKTLRALPDGRPLLLHVMDYFRDFEAREFVVCVGYRADAIRDVLAEVTRLESGNVTVAVVDSGVTAGKCKRLLDARAHIGQRRFLLGYSDILSDVDLDELVRVHERGRAGVTMAVTRVRSRFGRVTLGAGSLVSAFEEKPVEPALISAGYFVCEPELFNELDHELEFEADVLTRLAASQRLHAYQHHGIWASLDTYKDFQNIASLISREGYAWRARAA